MGLYSSFMGILCRLVQAWCSMALWGLKGGRKPGMTRLHRDHCPVSGANYIFVQGAAVREYGPVRCLTLGAFLAGEPMQEHMILG